MRALLILLLLLVASPCVHGQGMFSFLQSLNPFRVSQGLDSGAGVAPPVMVMDPPTVDMGVYNPLAFGSGFGGMGGLPFGLAGGMGVFPLANALGMTGFPVGNNGFNGGMNLPAGFSTVQQGNGPPLYVQQFGAVVGGQGEPPQQFGSAASNSQSSSWGNPQF